jgi:membrane protein YdbS with pleckstrin-like domain
MSYCWLSKKRWEGQTGTLSQKNWKSNFSAKVSLVLLVRVHVCVCVSAWYVVLTVWQSGKLFAYCLFVYDHLILYYIIHHHQHLKYQFNARQLTNKK